MKRRILATVFAVMLICAIATPTLARASYYITATSASIGSQSTGKVTISYSVLATGIMPTVGVDNIYVQVDYGSGWTYYNTYFATDNPSFLGSNKVSHTGSFTFTGVSGAMFRATLNSYAADSKGSDFSYVQTAEVKCK